MKRYIYRLSEAESEGFNTMLFTFWCDSREAADAKAAKHAHLFKGKMSFVKTI